jgi:hypothetical protein
MAWRVAWGSSLRMIVYEEGALIRVGLDREEEKANGRRKEVMEGSTRAWRISVSAELQVEEDALLEMDRAMTIREDE